MKRELLTYEQWAKLRPTYQGDTMVDDKGNYKMLWIDGHKLYYTQHNVFNEE